MHTTLLAYSFYLKPTSSSGPGSTRRVYLATFFFAFGAIFAWPFSLLLAIPFVFEELFIGGKDILPSDTSGRLAWRFERVKRLIGAGLVSSLIFVSPSPSERGRPSTDSTTLQTSFLPSFQIPVYLVDSHAYGRPTLPALNIVLYNLFSSTGGSPDLYGTEPTSFYLYNLFLNFNFLLPLALLSLPALAITYKFDYRRLGSSQRRPKEGETSPYTLVALRLSGLYLWLGVLSAQAHKEERFMWPAYPLVGLNAGIALFLVRGWVENGYAKIKNSSYQVRSQRPSPLSLFRPSASR